MVPHVDRDVAERDDHCQPQADEKTMNCKHCNGEMKPGVAIESTFNSGVPAFPGDKMLVTLIRAGRVS